MEFAWSPEQDELFEAARATGRGLAARRRERVALNGHAGWDASAWRACADFGLPGLCVPADRGGMGLDLLTSARVLEGFAEGCDDMGLVFAACAHLFASCVPVAEFGGDELRERVLPRLASGEWVGANAITEAEAGSDVLALQARAERDGDGYRLTGVKEYVTNGPVADATVVYARTNPNAGYLGLSAFLVETSWPGVTAGSPIGKIGLSGATIGSLYLDGVEVPAENRLGAEGQGALIFDRSMHTERACLFAGYLGSMQRQLDSVVEHACNRRQFGRPIGKNQAVSHRIAEMKWRLDAARMLLYRAAWLLDRGERATLEVSLAKLAVSDAAVRSGLDAIQIHGGLGVITETGIDRALRDAIPATIFSGTNELQREIVAGRLGL